MLPFGFRYTSDLFYIQPVSHQSVQLCAREGHNDGDETVKPMMQETMEMTSLCYAEDVCFTTCLTTYQLSVMHKHDEYR